MTRTVDRHNGFLPNFEVTGNKRNCQHSTLLPLQGVGFHGAVEAHKRCAVRSHYYKQPLLTPYILGPLYRRVCNFKFVTLITHSQTFTRVQFVDMCELFTHFTQPHSRINSVANIQDIHQSKVRICFTQSTLHKVVYCVKCVNMLAKKKTFRHSFVADVIILRAKIYTLHTSHTL